MTAVKTIEIEHRARFSKAEYGRLKNFLNECAEDLGEDDKDVFFFILPDKLVKTVNNTSKGAAKIVLKTNKIGEGSDFEEIEVPITPRDFEKATKLFAKLELGQVMHSFQKRHNYRYKGVEVALKWSEEWGHHLELEIVINSLDKKEAAEKKIATAAKELGVTLMTDQELKEFTQAAEKAARDKEK